MQKIGHVDDFKDQKPTGFYMLAMDGTLYADDETAARLNNEEKK